ncbi:MAG: hypothetical protein AAF412_03865, partial [Pseudomonadota bacterium]
SSIESLETARFGALDLDAIAAEDQLNEAFGKPPRFALPNEVSISPLLHGDWSEDGDMSIWRYRVSAEVATSLNFGFDQVFMPKGARLYIYTVDAASRGEMDVYEVLGPYGTEINETHRQFWTPIIQGEDVVIELNVPTSNRDQVSLELIRVNQGYRGFGESLEGYFHSDQVFGEGKQSNGDCAKGTGGGRSGSCNTDVACLADDDLWNDPRRAVGALVIGGSGLCTGSLVNNTANDGRMLFISATHCGVNVNSAPSMVVYWNYEWPSCRTPGDGTGTQVGPRPDTINSGATWLASTEDPFNNNPLHQCTSPGNCSDTSLVELDDPANPDFDLFWAGWDRRDIAANCGPQGAPDSTTGLCASIHHPAGHEKRITFSETDFEPGAIGAANGVHWTSFWHLDPPILANIPSPQPTSLPIAVTEGGSSGSPLYNANRQLVGVLSGGSAACGRPPELQDDQYGALFHAWEGLGTPTTRMRDYLDPLGTNPEFIEGIGAAPFQLEATPSTANVCAADGSIDFTIDVLPDPGFTDSVTLTVNSGEPPGSTTGFSANPVTPPGSSTLTIGNLAGATAGNYQIQILGTAGGDESSISLPFVLNDMAPVSVDLQSPLDNSTNVSTNPTLQWSNGGSGGATDYLVEIATDSGFSNMIFSESFQDTLQAEISPALLTSTEYFWRVTASNACGVATSSATFSFITVPAPGDCPTSADTITQFQDDIESGPNGWIVEADGGDVINNTWQRSQVRANSGVWSWHAQDVAFQSDQRLRTPAIQLPSAAEQPITLSFQNWQEIEQDNNNPDGCWDAGILEISTDDGTSWTQIDNASLLTKPYDGTVNGGTSTNPLVGLQAWCTEEDLWVNNIVDVSAFAGQEVRFRFRLGSDGSVGQEGWYIDDFRVQSCEASEELFADGFESLVQQPAQ